MESTLATVRMVTMVFMQPWVTSYNGAMVPVRPAIMVLLVGRHGRWIGSLEYKKTTKIMEKTVLEKPIWGKIRFENRFGKKTVLGKPILEKNGFGKPILEKLLFGKTDFGKNEFWKTDFGKRLLGKTVFLENRFLENRLLENRFLENRFLENDF